MENDVYVYPGHWAVDKDDKVWPFFFFAIYSDLMSLLFEPVWMVKNSLTNIQIYLNLGLIELIKMALFNGPTGFEYKFKQYYVLSHPDLKELKLTIPIVTFGATAVSSSFPSHLNYHDSLMSWYKFFTALYKWCEGKKGKMSSDSQKAKAKKFEGDNSKKVYDQYMRLWQSWRRKWMHTTNLWWSSIQKSHQYLIHYSH